MRVFVDTNTLLSAIVFPKGTTALAFQGVLAHHRLVLCTYVLEEAKRVIESKFPSFVKAFALFINSLDFELVYTPTDIAYDETLMRDPKDVPILITAQRENVDIILTGDKDFHALEIKHPEILSASQFVDKYLTDS